MESAQFICANWSADSTDCKKFSNYTCKGCHLVVYCSSDCQESHWALHKIDCESYLGQKTWRPNWVLEKRTPEFILHSEPFAPLFSDNKFLWGNVPAFDVLQLGANEGDDYSGPLNLLFAASGDLRNVVKTISQLPGGYNKPIGVTINDRDLDVVARNTIVLLIALVADNMDEAVDCMIHVWYSALIRRSDLEILQQRILPLVERVCKRIKDKEPDSLCGKTWTFGQRSLRLVLQKSSWDRLLAYMKVPEGLTAERASRIRIDVTLAESRKDYLDHHLIFQSPSRRIAKHRFRQDGLLLPFGSPRHEFQEPNPTLFQVPNVWPMADCADPLQGWSLKDVEDCSSGPATADIYGKLFYHLRSVLRAFILRVSNLQVSFRLFCLDFLDLPNHLERGSFSRIEDSNVSDSSFVGVHLTVPRMAPLLQGPLINPHATLITLFREAVAEAITEQEIISEMFTYSPTMMLLREYLSPEGLRGDANDPRSMVWAAAISNVLNFDPVFDRFVKDTAFCAIEYLQQVAIKEEHTVIDKWPFRLKLRYGQPGALEELDQLVDEVIFAKDRYVEWRRT